MEKFLKLRYAIMMVLALAMSVSFTSCKDDDDDPEDPTYSEFEYPQCDWGASVDQIMDGEWRDLISNDLDEDGSLTYAGTGKVSLIQYFFNGNDRLEMAAMAVENRYVEQWTEVLDKDFVVIQEDGNKIYVLSKDGNTAGVLIVGNEYTVLTLLPVDEARSAEQLVDAIARVSAKLNIKGCDEKTLQVVKANLL